MVKLMGVFSLVCAVLFPFRYHHLWCDQSLGVNLSFGTQVGCVSAEPISL